MTDGERIRVLMGARNQAAFAREHKIPGGASMVSQHMSGHRPVSIDAALAYARGFGVPLDQVSPAAATLIASAPLSAAPTAPTTPATPTLEQALEVVSAKLAAADDITRPAMLAALHRFIDDPAQLPATVALMALLERGAAAETAAFAKTRNTA